MITVHCVHLPQLIPKTRFLQTRRNRPSIISNTPNQLPNSRVVSAQISEEKLVESSSSSIDSFKLTYLELDDLPEIDCLLITRSLDDHCHLKTLKPLSQKLPNLKVIAAPIAKPLLDPIFTNVIYLEPGQNSEIQTHDNFHVKIRATVVPVHVLPGQQPENGYIVTSPNGELSLYYEPHCLYDKEIVRNERADIGITPVVKYLVRNFPLVSGQEDAVRLAKLLNSKFVVPMNNGDLDSKGVLSKLIKSDGTIESFKELLWKELPDVKTLEPIPGVPLQIP